MAPPTVVISPARVAKHPDRGGHVWVFLQYVQGLRELGCEVFWLEHLKPSGDPELDARRAGLLGERLEAYGLGDRVILYSSHGWSGGNGGQDRYFGLEREHAEDVFAETDLLLNFYQRMHPALLSRFRKTALLDIDPGLLQFWISTNQMSMAEHDLYFTTGETVATDSAAFPDCGLTWIYTPPAVSLQLWPFVHDPSAAVFTTVSSWHAKEWVKEGDTYYDNNKRASFLEFIELPGEATQPLELALFLDDGEDDDRRLLERHGWRIRHARDVAGTPEDYRSYLQRSRGEFSCAKPSCMRFRNAWVSDRSLCYLASGKPVVVQDTGPSSFLPDGEGMFRFKTLAGATRALEAINADYERHSHLARRLVEEHFDAKAVAARILELTL
jgi:glycosyltransferase involved in cell wall biosynthesis